MLAFEFAASLPMIVIVLLASGLLAGALASWAHAHNHAALAEDLDVAHEALDCAGEALKLIASGKTAPEALAALAPSPEAQDLLRRFRVFAHLGMLLLAFLFCSGCSAEQLAREEAIAHTALLKLENAVDWAAANPAVVKQLLEDARAKTSDPGALKAIDKAEEALTNGDLAQARTILLAGAQLTAPPPPTVVVAPPVPK